MLHSEENRLSAAAYAPCRLKSCFAVFPPAQMRELRGDAVCARLGQLRAMRHAPEEEQLPCAALRRPHGGQGGGDSQEGAEDVSEGEP